jgi:hypothetical protein
MKIHKFCTLELKNPCTINLSGQLPTQHYVTMFKVLFFWVVYYASQINIIVSLVNQKISINVTIRNSYF